MENNQQTGELATTVLAQIYSDYKKEKKWAKIYKYFYYGILAIILAFIFSSKDKPSADQLTQDKPFVAIVKFHGVIGSEQDINAEDFAPYLEKTFKNPNVVGVVLDIDSPGGGVYDTYMIDEKIQQMKQKYPDKKVTSYVRSAAASGGYWLSVASDKIYASPVSVIGSIGVLIPPILDISEIAKEYKLNYKQFTAGRHKAMGSMFKPLTDEEADIIQNMLDEMHSVFINTIQSRRGDRLDKTDPDLFSGLFWKGSTAVKKGLIDYCNVSFEDMIKAEYGDYNYSYVKPDEPPFSLAKLVKDFKESMEQSRTINPFAKGNGPARALYAEV